MENICRNALEELTGKPFPNTRPKWLINPKTNEPLELDCYNPDLRIALEYNGIQHYEYPNPFHTSQAQFEDQQFRDKIKRELCHQYKVDLIIVPDTIPKHTLKEQVKSTAHKLLCQKLFLLDYNTVQPYILKPKQLLFSLDFSNKKRYWFSIFSQDNNYTLFFPLANHYLKTGNPGKEIKRQLRTLHKNSPISFLLAHRLRLEGEEFISETSYRTAYLDTIPHSLSHWLRVNLRCV